MMKIGWSLMTVRAILRPKSSCWAQRNIVCTKLITVMMAAIYQYRQSTSNRLRTSIRAQLRKVHPSHIRGDHSSLCGEFACSVCLEVIVAAIGDNSKQEALRKQADRPMAS